MWALQYIGLGSAPKMESVLFEGKPCPISNFVQSLLSHIGNSASREQISSIERIFKRAPLPSDHPFRKKVEGILHEAKVHPLTSSKEGDTLEVACVKQGFIQTPRFIPVQDKPAAITNPKVFRQNNEKIEYVKDFIQKNGAELQELYLTSLDNDLVSLIASQCTKLTKFSYELRPDRIEEQLTAKGLLPLGTLPNLKSLTLSYWNAFHGSLNTLLQSPQLKSNLEELNVVTFLFNDTSFQIVSAYTKLSSLKVVSANLSTVGMEAFIQAPNIQATLQKFHVRQGENWGTIISDTFLKGLSLCKNMRSLSLNGKWSAASTSLESVLAALTGLTALRIDGTPISSKAASLIGNLKLQKLSIADCSLIQQPDYENMWTGDLKILGMGELTWLEDLTKISSLSNLQHLSLNFATGEIYVPLEPIFDKMQTQLKSLYLQSYNRLTPEYLEKIGKLKALECLRLVDMRQFNDISMTALAESGLAQTLKTLELNGVSISDASAHMWGNFSQLQNLMIASCYALTKTGMSKLLSFPTMQKNLLRLSLYYPALGSSEFAVTLLEKLSQLSVLFIGNASFNTDPLEKMKNLSAKNGVIVTYAGILTPFGPFIQTV